MSQYAYQLLYWHVYHGGTIVHMFVLACVNVCYIVRLTVMGTQGQTSHKTVKMKGRHTCQSIRLASSHQEVLEVRITIYTYCCINLFTGIS